MNFIIGALILGCNGKNTDSASVKQTQFIDRNDSQHAPVNGQCTTDKKPILMAHGFLAAGDTYDELALRLVSNGHCQDKIFTFDWNTLSQDDTLTELQTQIVDILEQTGATSLDLMGHSAGGSLGLSAITSEWGPDLIRRYIHLGSTPTNEALPIPTLNLYSFGDTVVQGADMPNATNVVLSDADHFEVATRVDAFETIYEFLYEEPPQTTDILQESTLSLWGKALTFGENIPLDGVNIDWYALDTETGQRRSDIPDFSQEVGTHGLFGPIPAATDTAYEIRLDADIPVRHYYTPFTASHRHLRLRGIPESGLAATLLSSIPFDDDTQVKLVSFSKQHAMLHTRDSLTMNGTELLTEDRASPEDTLIALFHYDNGNDGSEGVDPAQFNSFPFIRAVDQVIPADPEQHFQLQLNNRTLNIPQWGDGAIIGLL